MLNTFPPLLFMFHLSSPWREGLNLKIYVYPCPEPLMKANLALS